MIPEEATQPRARRMKSPLPRRLAIRNVVRSPDPVLLAALEIDRVGPAVVRASASGAWSVSQPRTKPRPECFVPLWPKQRGDDAPIDWFGSSSPKKPI